MFSAMRCSLELEDDEPEPRALEPRRAAAAAAATAEQLQRQQHAAAARWPGSSSKQQYAVEKHGGGGEEKDRAESGQKQLEEAWRLALGFRRGRDWGNMRQLLEITSFWVVMYLLCVTLSVEIGLLFV